uniref:EXPERA domain-containing protein n=1 Tax=Kalanchoe fedtschenkoi TaxID=63787 RepID=A0A7N0TU78_KALFE
MGFLRVAVEAILFLGFLVIAVFAPTLDAQTCLPSNVFPDALVDLKKWYSAEYGDYLTAEKPSFFVGLIWVELVFQWPLAVVNLYGIVARKSWFSTTCLMYGVSTLTSMVAILAEMLGSGRASDKLLSLYYPFLGLAVLSILRGLVPTSSKPALSSGRRPLPRKKRD